MQNKFCCGKLAHAFYLNTIWYVENEQVWVADFWDNLDETEHDMEIEYCPFCGAKLELPLTNE